MKRFSIITICYNEPNLKETCESIINQTYQDFEWIVIDGGSNAETLSIFEKYKHRINIFISEKDNGIYNAYNKGIKLSQGEYVNFMNAGDRFYTNNTLKLCNCFIEDSTADIYYGEFERIIDNNVCIDRFSNMPKKLTTDFLVTNNINTQSTFIKRELFEQFGLFNEKFKIASDYEKWIQIFKADKNFAYLPLIVATYDQGGISTNGKYRRLSNIEGNKVRNMYFSKAELNSIESQNPLSYTFLQRIFSIKTSVTKTHKIITILNKQFKIKRR